MCWTNGPDCKILASIEDVREGWNTIEIIVIKLKEKLQHIVTETYCNGSNMTWNIPYTDIQYTDI